MSPAMFKSQMIFQVITLVLLWGGSLGCSSVLYYPDRYMYVDQELMEYKPVDHVFQLQDGLQVHSWYFSSRPKPKGIVVFFHGNGQNRTSHFVGLYWLLKEGYDLFALEYPGYGDTDGKPTPENTVEAGRQALRYVFQKFPKVPIIVYGQSLGGAVAMRAVLDLRGEVPVSLIVADSTFLSYKKVGQKILARSWLTWLLQPLSWVLLSDKFAPKNKISELAPIPILVIHDRHDPIVPFQMGEEVYKNAKEPKEFWVLENGGHAQPYAGPKGPVQRQRLLERLSKIAR